MHKHIKTGDNGWEDLGNAIILQAAEDYRSAKRKLKKNPFNHEALELKADVLLFFRSELYGAITTIDADVLIKGLDEEDI